MKGSWVITKDHLGDGAEGTIGPSITTLTAEEIKAKGVHFKMYDDDNELYYEGYCIFRDGEEGFYPLEDFGEPNAGCTGIKYRNKDGTYEWL
jgi:hypothetical protein